MNVVQTISSQAIAIPLASVVGLGGCFSFVYNLTLGSGEVSRSLSHTQVY